MCFTLKANKVVTSYDITRKQKIVTRPSVTEPSLIGSVKVVKVFIIMINYLNLLTALSSMAYKKKETSINTSSLEYLPSLCADLDTFTEFGSIFHNQKEFKRGRIRE